MLSTTTTTTIIKIRLQKTLRATECRRGRGLFLGIFGFVWVFFVGFRVVCLKSFVIYESYMTYDDLRSLCFHLYRPGENLTTTCGVISYSFPIYFCRCDISYHYLVERSYFSPLLSFTCLFFPLSQGRTSDCPLTYDTLKKDLVSLQKKNNNNLYKN